MRTGRRSQNPGPETGRPVWLGSTVKRCLHSMGENKLVQPVHRTVLNTSAQLGLSVEHVETMMLTLRCVALANDLQGTPPIIA